MPDHAETISGRIEAAAAVGMQPAVWADLQPDRIAIYDYTGQNRSFGELNANANRIARLLRSAGLRPGADEIAYIVSNCEAKVLFADARVAEAVESAAPRCPDLVLKVCIGGAIGRRAAGCASSGRAPTTCAT